ncbi:hypothetical protein EV384_6234 [Micromonospora kangleipakensis]|uniref:DUF4034 domain-containing protein n=2 Tax=Micromonospora kangleipakensis TaxID=1077942 RepID=A0A4V2GDW4_9ACTN|nr:hypothetical protein EV384_6234 [Micromonospora kangleipakensis]
MIAAMPAPLPAIDFDPAAAFPEVNDMRAALAARDWPRVRQLLDPRDWAGRSLLVSAADDVEGVGDFLRAVLARHPGDTVAATMLAAHLVDAGWKIRTSLRAEHVSREQFAQLHDHLRQAEQILIDVCARDPGNVLAWQERLTTAMGLQLGQAEARRRYDRLARYAPHDRRSQSALLQQLCPKWGGSWDKVFAFARERMLAAPEGAQNGVLLADAHFERYFDFDTDGERAAYVRDPRVAQDIWTAAQRSVLHLHFRREPGWVSTRSVFALWFGLLDQWAAAAAQFAALGHLGSEYPWSYLGGTSTLDNFRTEAYAKGGPR